MPFEKRPWLVAFWLNDRKLPLIPWKMSVAECVGSLTVILGVGTYLAVLIHSAFN